MEEPHNLNAPNAINPVYLSDKSIVWKKSFRFEVNHGECGQEPKYSDCENERERSELYYQWKSNEFGKAKNEQWKKEIAKKQTQRINDIYTKLKSNLKN